MILEGINVEKVKVHKYLGITFVDKMYWKCHVDVVVKKVHSRLYCLKTSGPLMSAKKCYRCFIQLLLAVL